MCPQVILALAVLGGSLVEPLPEEQLWQAVQVLVSMKASPRGPYAGVAWFCNDGSVLPPKSYACVDRGGGVQHGVLTPEAQALAKQGIYVGTVLTSLEAKDLLADQLYRARALLLETYLERLLGGWVLKLAKTYRGFRQIEDEREAARRLLIDVVQAPGVISEHRYLLTRLIRALPYGQDVATADEIRTLAGEIGDGNPDFEALRFKIHAMPEPDDITGVLDYAKQHTGEVAERARELAKKMRQYYDPATRRERLRSVRRWLRVARVRTSMDTFLKAPSTDGRLQIRHGLALLEAANRVVESDSPADAGERKLLALHVMGLVEELWVNITAELSRTAMSREEALALARNLVRAARLLGVLSPREAKSAGNAIAAMQSGAVAEYADGLRQLSRVVDWSRACVLADLGLALGRYRAVEPRADGAVDDILRSGVMLPLARLLDRLTEDLEELQGGGHRLVGIETDSRPALRGQNPGFALGTLRALTAQLDPSSLKRDEIALLHSLPPDLPRVAGVITVGAVGSLSHVSLLARNLGIPLANVDGSTAAALAKLDGQTLVLGVSAGRRVMVGPLQAMPAATRAQLRDHLRPEEPFLEIDAGKLDLTTSTILRLDDVSEEDSGVRVGPKGGELGRLRRLFADRVSDAAVIPFGAFLNHVSRPVKAGAPCPIDKLRAAYGYARMLPPAEAELLVLAQMEQLRQAILTAPFPAGFVDQVKAALEQLGKPGTFGVFVRSDTNCEDLKEFTGAGLNTTVPNVVDLDDILAAIRIVWASPFTPRSYYWRQRILRNPEHVYPSVILHRTVPSEQSGVLVTADLDTGGTNALTVSVSEGVAAVVDGGAPETVVLGPNGQTRLLASSRAATRKVIPPPPAQGVVLQPAVGRDPLLGPDEMAEIRALAGEILRKIPPADHDVPWDIEFGFVAGRAHLLQLRPLRASMAPATHPLLVQLDGTAKSQPRRLDLSAKVP